MKIEAHKEALSEYLEHVEQARHTIESSKRLLLLICSQAATEAISILLHKLKLLDESTIIKHTQLDSKNWWSALPDFKQKSQISTLATEIERARTLAYGTLKNTTSNNLIKNISFLFKLKELIEEVGDEKL